MNNDNVNNETTNDLLVGVMERQIKRQYILIIVLILGIVLETAGWLVYESQYDKVVITQEAQTDGGGDVNVSGVGSGEITNGESDTSN